MRVGKTLSVSGLIVFGTITSLFAKIGEFLLPPRVVLLCIHLHAFHYKIVSTYTDQGAAQPFQKGFTSPCLHGSRSLMHTHPTSPMHCPVTVTTCTSV